MSERQSLEEAAVSEQWHKLKCDCLGSFVVNGNQIELRIEAIAFLCDKGHKQGDLVLLGAVEPEEREIVTLTEWKSEMCEWEKRGGFSFGPPPLPHRDGEPPQ